MWLYSPQCVQVWLGNEAALDIFLVHRQRVTLERRRIVSFDRDLVFVVIAKQTAFPGRLVLFLFRLQVIRGYLFG